MIKSETLSQFCQLQRISLANDEGGLSKDLFTYFAETLNSDSLGVVAQHEWEIICRYGFLVRLLTILTSVTLRLVQYLLFACPTSKIKHGSSLVIVVETQVTRQFKPRRPACRINFLINFAVLYHFHYCPHVFSLWPFTASTLRETLNFLQVLFFRCWLKPFPYLGVALVLDLSTDVFGIATGIQSAAIVLTDSALFKCHNIANTNLVVNHLRKFAPYSQLDATVWIIGYWDANSVSHLSCLLHFDLGDWC